MLICPEASSAQNNIAAVSADGSTVCVLFAILPLLWRKMLCGGISPSARRAEAFSLR